MDRDPGNSTKWSQEPRSLTTVRDLGQVSLPHRHRQQTYGHGRGEEGDSGMNGESNMEAYTLQCVKQITNGNLLYDSGNSNQGSGTTYRGGMGREVQKGGDICIPTADPVDV